MGTLLALILSLSMAGCGHTTRQLAVPVSVTRPADNAPVAVLCVVRTTGAVATRPLERAQTPAAAAAVGPTSRPTVPSRRSRTRRRWIPEQITPQPYFTASGPAQLYSTMGWRK